MLILLCFYADNGIFKTTGKGGNMEKFFVRPEPENDDIVLGLSYDSRPTKDLFSIGGLVRDRQWMERIGTDFFSLNVFDRKSVIEKWTASNKIVLMTTMTRADFVNGCDAMRSAGVILIATKSMERVMR